MPLDPRSDFAPAGARIFIAGGDTLLGAALIQHLHILRADLVGVGTDEPDLTNAGQVDAFFEETRPEYVFLAAGKSGGIQANVAYPVTLMRDNILVTTNVLDAAQRYGVKRLLYLASSCTYPRLAPQPLAVESLWAGPLEPTNEAYATAKIAGLTMCQAYRQQYGSDFVAAIPANSFGPSDDFSAEDSHVIPGLIRRLHQAKVNGEPQFIVWGTGKARREFVYSRDLAEACVHVMAHYKGHGPINLGGGLDLSIAEVSKAVAETVGYRGKLVFDISKPDGMPLKGLNATPLRELGWTPTTDFRSALAETYEWFARNVIKEDLGHVRAAV